MTTHTLSYFSRWQESKWRPSSSQPRGKHAHLYPPAGLRYSQTAQDFVLMCLSHLHTQSDSVWLQVNLFFKVGPQSYWSFTDTLCWIFIFMYPLSRCQVCSRVCKNYCACVKSVFKTNDIKHLFSNILTLTNSLFPMFHVFLKLTQFCFSVLLCLWLSWMMSSVSEAF